MNFKVFVFLCTVLFGSCIATTLEPGYTFSVKAVVEREIDYSFFKLNSKAVEEYTAEILSIDAEGNTTAQVTVVNLSYQDDYTDAKEAYNENYTLSQIVDVMKVFPFEVTFAPTGQILKLSGYEGLSERVCPLLEQGDSASEEINELFSENSLKASFGQFLCSYNSNALKVGSTWMAQTLSTVLLSEFIENHTFNVTSIQKDQVGLKDTFTISAADFGSIIPAGELGTLTLTGAGQGTLVIDKSTGLLLSSTRQGTFKGSMDCVDFQLYLPFELKQVQRIESRKL